MFEIEVLGKNTSFFCSTKGYELTGPTINELVYINLYGGVSTMELYPGDEVLVYSQDGSESVKSTIEED